MWKTEYVTYIGNHFNIDHFFLTQQQKEIPFLFFSFPKVHFSAYLGSGVKSLPRYSSHRIWTMRVNQCLCSKNIAIIMTRLYKLYRNMVDDSKCLLNCWGYRNMRTSWSTADGQSLHMLISLLMQQSLLLTVMNSFWKSTSLFTILKAGDSSSRVMKWTSSVFLPVQKLGISLREGGWWKRPKRLPTGTGVHCHIWVDLEDHVLVFIKEEDAEGRHLFGYAAGLWDARDHSHRPYDALNGGVVRRFQRLVENRKKKFKR